MCHTTLLDSKFVEFLVRTDDKMAEEMRADRCRQCGKALHLNSFPRKPRGMPPEWTTKYFNYRASTARPAARVIPRRPCVFWSIVCIWLSR
jgi:hypothetical protein